MDEFNTPIKDIKIHFSGVAHATACEEISDKCGMLMDQIPAEEMYTYDMSSRVICNGDGATCRRF